MSPPDASDLATRLHAVTAQIREMAGKATEGPWDATCMGSEGYHVHELIPRRGKRRRRTALCTYEDWETDKANATFIASMSPDIAILIADAIDAVAEAHVAIRWPHDDDHEYVCARCGLDSPCPDLTAWLPLVDAFEARR